MDLKGVLTARPSARKSVPDTLQTESEEFFRSFIFGVRISEQEIQVRRLPSSGGRRSSMPSIHEYEAISHQIEREKRKTHLRADTKTESWDRVVVDHRRLGAWELVRDLAILYSLVTTMFFLAFEKPGFCLWVVDIAVWVFFVLDLSLRFFLSYEDDEGHRETSFRRVSLHYCRTWFLLDFLSVLPFQFSAHEDVEYYFRMLRLLKVSDSLSFVDGTGLGAVLFLFAPRHGKKRSQSLDLTTKWIGSILFILILMTFYTYSMACLWMWFSQKVAGLGAISLPGKGGSFDDYFTVESAWQKWERSWYFMITTLVTVGYGDYGATNSYEALLLILILFTGVTTYSFVIGQFNSLVAQFDGVKFSRISEFTIWVERLETLNSALPPDLKCKLLSEFTYYDSADRLKVLGKRWWDANSVEELTEEDDFYVRNLPEITVQELKTYLFSDILTKYRLFFGSDTLKYDVCFHFHPRKFAVGELLLDRGEEVQEVFFSLSGVIAIGDWTKGEFIPVIQLAHHAIVDDYSALLGVPAYAAFKSVGQEPVSGFALPVKPLLAILKGKYPAAVPRFIDFARTRASVYRATIESHIKGTGRRSTEHSKTTAWMSLYGEKDRETRKTLREKTEELECCLKGLEDAAGEVGALTARFRKDFLRRRAVALRKAAKVLKRDARRSKKKK